jgi:hypothetical protein
MSALAQYDMTCPSLSGLLLLLFIVALLFWRKSRRPRAAPQAQSESGDASSQIVVPPSAACRWLLNSVDPVTSLHAGQAGITIGRAR